MDISHLQNKLHPQACANLKLWLSDPQYQEFVPQIQQLISDNNITELNDSFYTSLRFGTGGRRGKMGVGPNRINARTIAESAQGLANYITKQGQTAKDKGVVIAYDTRHNSKEFAQVCAEVFGGNGIKVYLYQDIRSTPQLSFSVRHLKAQTGVMISASHNPPTDNGFKGYWQDGGQFVAPHDRKVLAESMSVAQIQSISLEEAKKQNLLELLGEEIDNLHHQAVIKLSLAPSRSAHIVFSPLHGTATTSVLPILQKIGFSNITTVDSQMTPDGDFPNVLNNIPNPEFPPALQTAIDIAKEKQADIVLVADPDADRLGAAVPLTSDKQAWQCLTGNQIGSLLLYYILTQRQAKGSLPKRGIVAETCVTTDLIWAMAEDFGLATEHNLLIGFKYIADLINDLPQDTQFVFGVEESHGYLYGDYVRDKDGAVASMLLAELVSYLKDQGKTISDYFQEIYRKYGYYTEKLDARILEGMTGRSQILSLMYKLRHNPPQQLAGLKLQSVTDRSVNIIADPNSQIVIDELIAEPGDVLVLNLSEDKKTRITIRPSGTESKIKVYVQLHQPSSADSNQADQLRDQLLQEIMAIIDQHLKS